MILMDTGPLVAIFDPKDRDHQSCHKLLRTIEEPLLTTEAVITEVLHLLAPGSRGVEGLTGFIMSDYLSLITLDKTDYQQSFQLMDKYADLPMDFADATLVTLAEKLKIDRVFTLDFADFNAYRIKKGHRYCAFDLLQ